MRNEDLYEDMQERDRDEEQRYRVVAPKTEPRRLPNEAEARARYLRDIAPLLKKQKKAEQSPVYRAFLRFTGQLKDAAPEVNPVAGIAVHDGMSHEEVRKHIIAHPELYPDLAKQPPKLEKKK